MKIIFVSQYFSNTQFITRPISIYIIQGSKFETNQQLPGEK